MADENTQNNSNSSPNDPPDDGVGVSEDEARRLLNVGSDGKAGTTEPPATDTEAGNGEDSAPDDSTEHRSEVERWKRFSRKNEQQAKDLAEKLKRYEDANKSESERLQQDRDSHRTRADKAETQLKRREIAEETAPDHATVTQVRKVARRLAGDTDEALTEDAKELWADFAPAQKQPTPGRPKERLRGGGDPDEPPDENDPAKLAALVPRAR